MLRTALITLAIWALVTDGRPGNSDLQAEWEAFKAETGILPLNQADESRMKANWAKAKARVDANNANPNTSEKEKVYDFDVLSGQTMTYAFSLNHFI